MNKVVVVGANGFIGSHLCLHLAAQGYQVIALVQKGFPYDFLQKKDNITCLDFSFDDLNLLNGNPNLEGATMLYHLAGLVSAPLLRTKPSLKPKISSMASRYWSLLI